MADAQDIPEAIQWHEGMLLAPQHFQQLSVRQEELLHYRIRAAAPFCWGVHRFKLDPVLLIEGTFRVLELEAVMPDGLVVHHRHPGERDLEIDLTRYGEELKQKPVAVHLAVPALKLGEESAVRGALPRYDSVEGSPIPDVNTGESELAIPRLRPRISLLVTDTPPQKYTTFPLAKVAYRNEAYGVTDFIPPATRVAQRSELWEICTAVAQRLREKAVFLAEKVSAPNSALRGPMILDTKLLIQSLVSGLPQFEAVLNTGVSHPYSVYLSLCNLVGHIAAVGSALVPPALDAYNHNDLRRTFQQAAGYISRMIDEGILESHTAVPFDFAKGIFSLRIDPEWMAPSLIVGLRAKAGVTDKEVEKWMSESLIGSAPVIESLKSKRILGAEREKIEGDDQLVPARGVSLFRLAATPEFIVPDKPLVIFNTSDPKGKTRPTEITLYVKNPTT